LARTRPLDAEQLYAESLSIAKAGYFPFARQRQHLAESNSIAISYARHLLRMVSSQELQDGNEKGKERLALAKELFQEAITTQRKISQQYGAVEDKSNLVNLLSEEAMNLLKTNPSGQSPSAADKLRADALLTETLQLCRALAAEFPNNTDYKSRLTALEKLHAQHFGQKNAVEQPK
jgi:hypothetical protein